jgi:hypothetical protein
MTFLLLVILLATIEKNINNTVFDNMKKIDYFWECLYSLTDLFSSCKVLMICPEDKFAQRSKAQFKMQLQIFAMNGLKIVEKPVKNYLSKLI